MFKYSNPFALVLLVALFVSCRGDFVRQGDFEPTFGSTIKILEGKFAVLDLFHVDSVPASNNQIIELTNELNEDLIDFSSLIPGDSLYTSSVTLLENNSNFQITDHGKISQSVSQLQFIQAFSPGDFSLFNTNNGSAISWSGCNSYANYYFGSIAVPQVFDQIHIDSGVYDITLVNNFDFDVIIGVALKSNPSILFSQVVSIAKNDSATFSASVFNKDANASYNWTIYQVSSPGIAIGTTTVINNFNLFELKVSRSNAYLSSGKFRPISNVFADVSIGIPLPFANASKFNYIEASDIDLSNVFQATGLNSTSLELHRTITDNFGIIYSDMVYVISNPTPINWVAGISNKAIQPIKGKINVNYKLISTNSIIDIAPSKFIQISHGFTSPPDVLGLGLNEDWIYSFTSTTTPYSNWPEELTLKFIPQQSQINKQLNGVGWGNISINAQYQNHMGIFTYDSTTLNLGSSFLDSSTNATNNWSLSGFSVNSFNTLTPDSITVTTNYTFKAPWGFKTKGVTRISSTAKTNLTSSSGSAFLSTEKLLHLSDNNKLDSLINSCDSVSAYAVLRSKTSSPLINSFSLTRNFDTIVVFDEVFLNAQDSVESNWKNIKDITSLNSSLNFKYDVDFAAPIIKLYYQDSLFLDFYLKFNGLP
tara:strand:+ start:5708 stop:7657 length:1950 start_codon:yes stop_codon:yes gene_type:complete